jgi:Ser/Thr protein kinase RdoA (MazF antagonist)
MNHVAETPNSNGVLSPATPKFSEAQAEQIASTHYGLTVSARLLAAERDQNFKLTDAAGERYVLKISHPGEDPAVTDFQTQLLIHIADQDPALPVPGVLRSTAGEVIVTHAAPDGIVHRIRLLQWLDGNPLSEAKTTAKTCASLGAFLAKLDLAMSGFEHPASQHEFNWNMLLLPRLRSRLRYIDDFSVRLHATDVLNRFENVIAPRLKGMRQQVIYNDLNPSNVLVTQLVVPRIAGVIDFGDAVMAPLVVDLAVACAYQLEDSPQPFLRAHAMIHAYHARNPLRAEELDLLFDLITARLLLTVTITHWHVAKNPANRAYIMRNCPHALANLKHLRATGERVAAKQFKQLLPKAAQ